MGSTHDRHVDEEIAENAGTEASAENLATFEQIQDALEAASKTTSPSDLGISNDAFVKMLMHCAERDLDGMAFFSGIACGVLLERSRDAR